MRAQLGPFIASWLLFAACGSSHGSRATSPDGGGTADGSPVPDAGPVPDATPVPDGAARWPDSGEALPPPEWADLSVGPLGSCPPFSPCGGDVVGTWDTNGGCFEVDVESYLSSCPGATVTRREGRGRGRVRFGADGFAVRIADAEVDVDVFYPEICARYYSCDLLEAGMAAVATSARCTARPSGDCDCTMETRVHIDQRDFYAIEGDEIVSESSGKRWEYCIAGDRLDYRDTSPLGAREPGVVELRRR